MLPGGRFSSSEYMHAIIEVFADFCKDSIKYFKSILSFGICDFTHSDGINNSEAKMFASNSWVSIKSHNPIRKYWF